MHATSPVFKPQRDPQSLSRAEQLDRLRAIRPALFRDCETVEAVAADRLLAETESAARLRPRELRQLLFSVLVVEGRAAS